MLHDCALPPILPPMKTSITPEQIKHIARLARLRFSPEELDGFTEQFNQILDHVEMLNEVDTSGVEPMTSPGGRSNVMRDDQPGPMLAAADALRNAPKKTEGFFSVPKVIGDVSE
jgi:aspartyl-tRNA(Asn)/glutamyl-tRNA(Gln) amidotransferase subunit C